MVHLIFTGIYLKAIKTHLSNHNYTYLTHINFSFSIMFLLFFFYVVTIFEKSLNNLGGEKDQPFPLFSLRDV